jgi:hypothetical protein
MNDRRFAWIIVGALALVAGFLAAPQHFIVARSWIASIGELAFVLGFVAGPLFLIAAARRPRWTALAMIGVAALMNLDTLGSKVQAGSQWISAAMTSNAQQASQTKQPVSQAKESAPSEKPAQPVPQQ